MFDPTEHKLLTDEAAALDSSVILAGARLAEDFLGLDGATYETLDETGRRRWGEMVVLQLNYQLQHTDAEALVQEGVAGYQKTFRKGELVSEKARALRDRFFSDYDTNGGSLHLDAIES